jgi:hypothetical protein
VQGGREENCDCDTSESIPFTVLCLVPYSTALINSLACFGAFGEERHVHVVLFGFFQKQRRENEKSSGSETTAGKNTVYIAVAVGRQEVSDSVRKKELHSTIPYSSLLLLT